MGKIEDAVRATVARTVARELRKVLTPLAQDVKELKRTLAELQMAVSSAQEGSAAVAAQPKAEAAQAAAVKKGLKVPAFLPAQIRSLRARLGTTQGQMAALVGVSDSTIKKWERGERKPTEAGHAALSELAGKSAAEAATLLKDKKVKASRGRIAKRK